MMSYHCEDCGAAAVQTEGAMYCEEHPRATIMSLLVADSTHEENLALALSCARGQYQRAIVLGHQRLSGADLRGRAKHFGAAYARSRAALLRRMHAAGVRYHEESGAHGRRLLVID